jgi:transcriptional regulator with XRE-family HTH domain
MRVEWFGARLRQIREAARLTQQQLAARVPGLAVRTVSYIETGAKVPGWDTVLGLCVALGCRPDDFASDPGEVRKRKRGRPRKQGGAGGKS